LMFGLQGIRLEFASGVSCGYQHAIRTHVTEHPAGSVILQRMEGAIAR
jgi:hypothetical protein